jgi:hypothetical protein
MSQSEETPKFTIADDYDPDVDIVHGADPMAEYLTYLDCVRAGAVDDMGFTLEDFKRYIAAASLDLLKDAGNKHSYDIL